VHLTTAVNKSVCCHFIHDKKRELYHEYITDVPSNNLHACNEGRVLPIALLNTESIYLQIGGTGDTTIIASGL
jgi:hypothetical protein